MPLQTEREKIAHLLRRFGLGASESEIDYYGQGGLKGAIDKLLNYDSVEQGFELELSTFQPPNKGRVNIRGVQAWWVLRMLTTRRPLQEKMALFWHDHFATSASKVNAPLMMYQQVELFRRMATGKFQDILLEVSKDPAMLFWLDNQYNVKGKPNENFAREVMELFTLGIGNYTEKDIQEASRAFTGWSIRRVRPQDAEENNYRQADFLFRPFLHDGDDKTVFGKTGPFGGEDVIALLCEQARTPVHLSTKLWEWFGYPNPEPTLINRLANNFRLTGLDVKALLRDIMESPEFYSQKAFRSVYKTPVDFCIPTLRQLGVGEIVNEQLKGMQEGAPRRFLAPVQALQQSMDAMGMELLFPPDVAGWDGGAAWVTTATMVERIQWADRIFGVAAQSPGKQRAQVRYPAYPLLQSDLTSMGAAKKLVSVFDAPLPEAKLSQVADAVEKASGGQLTPQNAGPAAAAATRLIFSSPEFQMM